MTWFYHKRLWDNKEDMAPARRIERGSSLTVTRIVPAAATSAERSLCGVWYNTHASLTVDECARHYAVGSGSKVPRANLFLPNAGEKLEGSSERRNYGCEASTFSRFIEGSSRYLL